VIVEEWGQEQGRDGLYLHQRRIPGDPLSRLLAMRGGEKITFIAAPETASKVQLQEGREIPLHQRGEKTSRAKKSCLLTGPTKPRTYSGKGEENTLRYI